MTSSTLRGCVMSNWCVKIYWAKSYSDHVLCKSSCMRVWSSQIQNSQPKLFSLITFFTHLWLIWFKGFMKCNPRCQQRCLGSKNPRYPRPQIPSECGSKELIQGFLWPWKLPWIKSSDATSDAIAIWGYLGFPDPRHLCWQCLYGALNELSTNLIWRHLTCVIT